MYTADPPITVVFAFTVKFENLIGFWAACLCFTVSILNHVFVVAVVGTILLE